MKKIKIYNTATQQWQDISAGQTGPQGPQGIQGVQGPAGADGKGILSANFNADNTLTLTFTDNTTYTTPSLKGATGATGLQGEQGPKGDTGDTGATGTGISSIYKTSTSGLVDTYTITFTNGVTITYDVTNGADGAAGPQGPQGPKGDTGEQGPAGTNGTNGTNGTDGITPTVTVTAITGGHNVAFSYGTGDARNTNFDVMDGEAGSGGGSYTAGTGIDITNGVISLALEQAEGVEV